MFKYVLLVSFIMCSSVNASWFLTKFKSVSGDIKLASEESLEGASLVLVIECREFLFFNKRDCGSSYVETKIENNRYVLPKFKFKRKKASIFSIKKTIYKIFYLKLASGKKYRLHSSQSSDLKIFKRFYRKLNNINIVPVNFKKLRIESLVKCDATNSISIDRDILKVKFIVNTIDESRVSTSSEIEMRGYQKGEEQVDFSFDTENPVFVFYSNKDNILQDDYIVEMSISQGRANLLSYKKFRGSSISNLLNDITERVRVAPECPKSSENTYKLKGIGNEDK